MDAEAMRRAGYATVDALVARLADPEGDPVLRRAGAADMRTRLGGPPPEQPGDYGAVLTRVLSDVLPYASDQAHSSLARTARAMGLRPDQVRVLPTDDRWRLRPETVAAAVRADREAGRIPFALCASAGSTNTGAVDPLAGLADVCAAEGLWLHVDAAYAGFAALTGKG